MRITIRVRDPAGANGAGRRPAVSRVDLIVGRLTGPRLDRDGDTNPSTQVVRRFGAADWTRRGEVLTMTYTLKAVGAHSHVRVRGTNTQEAEPTADPLGEDPWGDLWFYGNPIFVTVTEGPTRPR